MFWQNVLVIGIISGNGDSDQGANGCYIVVE
jgi:hypothetical protein